MNHLKVIKCQINSLCLIIFLCGKYLHNKRDHLACFFPAEEYCTGSDTHKSCQTCLPKNIFFNAVEGENQYLKKNCQCSKKHKQAFNQWGTVLPGHIHLCMSFQPISLSSLFWHIHRPNEINAVPRFLYHNLEPRITLWTPVAIEIHRPSQGETSLSLLLLNVSVFVHVCQKCSIKAHIAAYSGRERPT